MVPAELYKGAIPPLAILFRLADGRIVRFETGKDVWRWANAARIGDGSSTFIIRREGADLVYTWSLYAFAPSSPDTPPPPGRNWNITWSLQWGEPETNDGPFADVFDLRAECADCACAQGVENALKKAPKTLYCSEKHQGNSFPLSRVPDLCLCLSYSLFYLSVCLLFSLKDKDPKNVNTVPLSLNIN